MVIIESKRKKPATILKKYPDAILADMGQLVNGVQDRLFQSDFDKYLGELPIEGE